MHMSSAAVTKQNSCSLFSIAVEIVLLSLHSLHGFTFSAGYFCYLEGLSPLVQRCTKCHTNVLCFLGGDYCPSKHETLAQCCFNAGPTSETAGQH